MTASKFVGRQRELTELNGLLDQGSSQFLLCYGRRQVGKTTLLLRWAEQSGRPHVYWVATRDTPAQLRRSLAQTFWQWAYPSSRAAPRFDSWGEVLETAADLLGDQQVIVLLDQFSYGVESDDSLASHIQAAWDQRFKASPVILVLIGSHSRLMRDLIGYEAPLYGRITYELPVEALDFPFVGDFLPDYSPADRVIAYAVTGGVPAYLERFDDKQNVGENVQRLFMRRRSMFRNEPDVLISEVIRRETRNFEAILKAIAGGSHSPHEIGATIGQESSWLSPYLDRLQEVGLIERHLPATIPLEQRQGSRSSRYELSDPYLHFHFRFIAPNLRLVEQNLAGPLWQSLAGEFDGWVGRTAFRRLCQDWIRLQAERGHLPLLPVIGPHWSQGGEIAIVGINWAEHTILLADCHWRPEPVSPFAVQGLIDRADSSQAIPDKDWTAHYVLFARNGFAEPAREVAAERGVELVDLDQLDADLRQSLLGDEKERSPNGRDVSMA
ncbi:MAG: ATP-binding protein [Chloroflexia bacterium]|nr:ATP-binding protein [Chloroflexia bacterium]